MKKQVFALTFCLFLIGPMSSFAAPQINEFSSGTSDDWIEIYNPDDSQIDLSLYRIRDLTSNNKLDLSGTIAGKGFASFDWSNKLNNGGDLIKLVLISDESTVDQVNYGDQGGIVAPSTNQSGGREVDGSSNWVLFTASSKGSTNNSGPVFTLPSPTPTKTPSPTKSPTPTKTPTAAKSSSSTVSSSKTPTPKPVSSNVGSNSNVNPSSNRSGSAKISQNFKIASNFASIRNVSPVPSEKSNKVAVLGTKKNNFSPLIVLGGIILLLSGGFLFVRSYIRFEDIYEKIFNK